MHAGFSALREGCSMNCGVRIQLASLTPALKADLARLEELWLDGLDRFKGPFLAGKQFTAADAFFTPVAFRIQTYGLPLGERALEYAGRLRALPSMKAWYDAALAETFREPAHEADSTRAGKVLEDLRAKPA
jgi:glutathione S-transferase